MSSRVLLPGDPRPVEPVVWPKFSPPEPEPEPEAPEEAVVEEPPEPQIDLEQIEREWQARLEQGQVEAREQARKEALREGEAAGRTRAMAELQPVLDRLARSIDEIAGFRPRLRREAEADTVKLAIAIARRVIRRELSVDPDALHGLVLGALEKLQIQEISRVRLHPSHAPAVADLLRSRAAGATVELVSDPSAEPGAVVFETARGNLDASVESQLSEIERGLADTLRRQQ